MSASKRIKKEDNTNPNKKYKKQKNQDDSEANTHTIAIRALHLAKKLQTTRELKHSDFTQPGFYPGRNITDSLFIPTANFNQSLSDQDARVGDSIFAKYLYIQGSITLPDQLGITLNNVTNRQNFIRLWVAVWPSPNTASPNTDATNLFNVNNVQWVSPFGYKLWDERFRARLLFSKVYKINTYQPQVYFDVKVKLNFPIQFQDNSPAALSNNIMYGFISDNSTGILGGTYAYVHHIRRLTYTDP